MMTDFYYTQMNNTLLLHGIKFTACIVVCTVCMTAKRIVGDDDGAPMIIINFI